MTLSAEGPSLSIGESGPHGRSAPARQRPVAPDDHSAPELFAYYFPQWHADPRNDVLFGDGWTEWDVLRPAQPRFPGHHQPRISAWGEYDESDPVVASRAVAAALDHGVDGFIVDWYWYDNQPFLNGYLDRGLLHADRLSEFKFAIMWANHEWTELYPAKHGNPTVIFPAPNGRYHANNAFDHVLERYLTHPSYWRVNGAPYFSIYDIPGLIRGMGGVTETAELLQGFRNRARDAGVPELHLGAVINPTVPNPGELLQALGFDSATHYTWWHHADSPVGFPTTDYADIAAHAHDTWRATAAELPIPYFPNVSVGWDPAPRTVEWEMDHDAGYPFTTIVTGSTPTLFGQAVSDAIAFVEAEGAPRAITINAWNEWTEGSYLEPDSESGFAYLEAIDEAVSNSAKPDSGESR
jgi:hypothetical protein